MLEMNVLSKLQDSTRNSEDIPTEDAEIIQRRMEQWHGVRFTGRFHFANPAVEAIFKSSGEKASRLFIANADAHLIKRPFVAMYAADNSQTILLSGLDYNPEEVIMPVFGTLVDELEIKLDGMMIKTEMGLVITSDPYSGSWKFLKMSCKPNVEIKENWLQTEDENGVVKFTYSCCIVAIKPIKIGEAFRIDRNNLWKTELEYECNCEVLGCVGNRKGQLCCLEEGCPKFMMPYRDRRDYKKHIQKHAEANGEEIPCKERVPCKHECGKDFASVKSMQRHCRATHRQNPKKHPCPYCGFEFSRNERLKRHLFKSKKGCKAHQEGQRAIPSTELGLRTELSKKPAGRKCDGYKIIENDRASKPDQKPRGKPKSALKIKLTASKMTTSDSKTAKKQSTAPKKQQSKEKEAESSAQDREPSTSAAALGIRRKTCFLKNTSSAKSALRSATLAASSAPLTLDISVPFSRFSGSESLLTSSSASRTTSEKSHKKNWSTFETI